MTSIDLRSDTVTKPSAAMRAAMAAADVGDDVWNEDPTVQTLERETAAVLGKQAGLFVPSGTMGNIASVLAQCGRGDEIVAGDEAHLFYYEVAGVAALGGVQVRPIPNRRGLLDPAEIERAIRGENIHFPQTTLLCLENTHNRGGGLAIGVAETAAMTAVARRHGVAVHLDGARLFNAAVALGVEPRALTAAVDSVNVCFSKGLGAPIGSAIAGSHAFVERARKVRKMLGGGMRQVGVIAAAALLALRDGPKRLHVDHENARLFAQKLSESGDFVIAGDVATNIVVFSVARPDPSAADDAALLKRWADNGVLIAPFGPNLFRAVTHLDVSRDQVLEAADRIVADSPVPAAAR